MILLEKEIEALEIYRAYRIEKEKLLGIGFKSTELMSHEFLLKSFVWDLVEGDYTGKMNELINGFKEREEEAWIYEK